MQVIHLEDVKQCKIFATFPTCELSMGLMQLAD